LKTCVAQHPLSLSFLLRATSRNRLWLWLCRQRRAVPCHAWKPASHCWLLPRFFSRFVAAGSQSGPARWPVRKRALIAGQPQKRCVRVAGRVRSGVFTSASATRSCPRLAPRLCHRDRRGSR
jgi:hypothetical protein